MQPTQPPTELTARERRDRLAGVETRIVELDGSGPPLLLLHGYADSADTWRPLLSRLAAAERAAMAIDLTGFGTADALNLSEPMLPQWDRLVAAALEQLRERGGADPIVVGNSLGGALALRAAQEDAPAVAGIVPIAPAGLHMARWFPIIESERLIRLLRLSPVPVPELVVREIVSRVYRGLAFHDQSAADVDAVVATFAGHISTIDRSMAILDIGRRLLSELEDPFDLRRIDCPLLLVWGERDRMVYTAGAERVLRTVDYSDIEVIADCGHCPQVESPERLCELLLAFPDSIESAG